MKNSEQSTIEWTLQKKLKEIKDKTVITISDLEEFIELTTSIIMKIEELRHSRDNWRKKYEELKS